MITINTKYTSRDLPCVAYLLARGIDLDSYSISKGGLAYFTFRQSPELEAEIENYYHMKATINPITYSNSLRSLKTMLHTDRHDEKRLVNYEENNTYTPINKR